MAIRPTDSPDPAEGGDYDYRDEDIERPGLMADLDARVAGDVRFDTYTRQLYATDASIYEQTPIGVVFPTDTDDVASVVSYCAEREIPVLPRGGGTSLAGQTVNEAVVLDFTRHMDGLVSFDPDEAVARAEPGVTLGELNAELAPHDLKFAPDPAWGDKSVLGGAIGNNSTGSHSLKYGKTDAYVEECEVVLADGTVTTLGEVEVETLREDGDPEGDLEARIYAEVARILDEETGEIDARYPDLKRNVSGYNLDVLAAEAETGSVNLAKLLAGSEGTLAVVTEATVSLEPVPETKAVALLTYDDVLDAMEDVSPVLEHDPAAVEVMDDVLLDLASETDEFRDVVGMLPEGTDSVLLVEFYAEDDADGRQKVADLVADRAPGATTETDPSDGAAERTADPHYAVAAMEAHDAEERAKFWKMRKSGLPILLSRTSDEKHGSFIEDTAVPAENLPEFVADFQDVLDDHDTFASYYAHAGPGVLHIRPLVNTKTETGVETMESIADAVTDLVVTYGGSVSGEHGDGRARTQWNRKLYGEDLWRTFRDLKTAFDPDWLLNPGQVCGYDESEELPPRAPERARIVDMTENLRSNADYEFDAGFAPELAWDNDNGLQGMVELCHGCAGCRGDQETTGGVMCPTYRAADEEITSTRGRANMLRQAMSGDLPDEELFSEEFADEVLDLCIGCKGCKHDCPSGVDMAKLKAEIEHERHQREGVGLRTRLFANTETLLSVGSALAPLSNWATKLPGARAAMEKLAGIASERSLPEFRRETLRDWYADRGPQVGAAEADRKAMVLADPYTNYGHPEVGKAAVRALEAANVHVRIPNDVTDSGRPAFSKSLVDEARETARENVRKLAPRIEDGWDLVVAEPSDAVMFQSDYLDLLGDDALAPDAELVAANAYGVCEYVDTFRLDENATFDAPDETLTYHGHCHQKATKKDHHAVGVLRRAGYRVDPLDSGCCGMAGSFGYEAEHYSMSRAIGNILFDQVEDSDGETVVAPGASCRTQLGDREESAAEPPHPVEKLAAALAGR
ncbi:FAD-binding and (Fe-S)-binding domain-containing protein [Halorussus pelagicus]|uniref:FAD-binding and (Fe-S)-binding domain-containing protein n=1 Tax=Halorussus pelagicus TaxID=2505977 RepID=UPI000FFC26EB|nr:FAD-binding and (Fe-S)-binding domain-containing protein [Halorussus pelagicus]